MENKKQIAKNMAAQTVSFCLTILVSFFLTSFIVGKIGADVYGFVGLANNVTSYVTVFTVAINSLANRYITIDYVKGDITSANKYFSSVTAANILAVAVVAVPAVLLLCNLERVVNIPTGHVTDIKILWALVFSLFGLQLVFGRLEIATFATNRLDKTAMRTMESNIIKVITLVVLYMAFEAKVWYVGVSSVICGLYLIAANVHNMRTLTPELGFSRKLVSGNAVKEMLGTGIWNSANQMSQLLFNGLDLLIANLFIGAAEMGLLSIAKTPPMHLIAFIGMAAGVFYPNMTIAYAKGDIGEFVKETKFAIRICGLICSVPIMGVIVFGEPFYGIWLPTLSAAEIHEIQILSVLTLLPQVFSIYIFPLYQINTLTCKLKLPSIINIILGAVNVAAVFLLLEFTDLGLYAIAGVSSVLLLFRILIFVPMYASSNIKTKYSTFYPPLIRGVVLNVLLAAVFYAIKSVFGCGDLKTFIPAIAISGVIGYIIGFIVLSDKSDREKIKNIIKKR